MTRKSRIARNPAVRDPSAAVDRSCGRVKAAAFYRDNPRISHESHRRNDRFAIHGWPAGIFLSGCYLTHLDTIALVTRHALRRCSVVPRAVVGRPGVLL